MVKICLVESISREDPDLSGNPQRLYAKLVLTDDDDIVRPRKRLRDSVKSELVTNVNCSMVTYFVALEKVF